VIAAAVALTLLVAAVAGPCGYASTTYTGETGLLLAPSADTLGANAFAITYGRLGLADVVSVGVGLTPNFELGVGSAGSGHGASVYPLLKLRLVGESSDMPAVAVGLEDEALYVAASKRLSARGARAHVGFGSGRFDGLFAGVDLVLNPVAISSGRSSGFPVTTVIGEYVGGSFNVGARFEVAKGLALSLGLLDLDTFSAGVSFKMKF
jgi:hypothetical protein